MILGFTTGHSERICPGAYGFSKFSKFLENVGIPSDGIRGRISEESLNQYPAIVIGSPQHRLWRSEFDALRNYVSNGGRLLILMKFGGDSKSTTNMRKLFPTIIPNNDDLFDPKLFEPKDGYQGLWGYQCMKPIIPISIDHPLLQFEGEIVYDSGCTFTTEGNMTLTVMPRDDLLSYSKPAVGDDFVFRDLTQHEKLKPVMGPIMVYNKIGKGSVLYWGARWSFSDEHWDSYDNSAFFKAIMSLFLGEQLHDSQQRNGYENTQQKGNTMAQYKGNEKMTVRDNKERMERKLSVGDSFSLKGKIYRRVDARKHDGKKWILEKGTSESKVAKPSRLKSTSKKLINITSRAHFNTILDTYQNVIIDFTASWCGPCKQLKPILKRLNSEIDEVQIITVDVDKLEPIADEFHVMHMPTLIAMKNGKKRVSLENQSYTRLKKEIHTKYRL